MLIFSYFADGDVTGTVAKVSCRQLRRAGIGSSTVSTRKPLAVPETTEYRIYKDPTEQQVAVRQGLLMTSRCTTCPVKPLAASAFGVHSAWV